MKNKETLSSKMKHTNIGDVLKKGDIKEFIKDLKEKVAHKNKINDKFSGYINDEINKLAGEELTK